MRQKLIFHVFFLAGSLASCVDSTPRQPSSDAGTGILRVLIRDKKPPPGAVEEVWLNVDHVEACGASGCNLVGAGRYVELMRLTEGQSSDLGGLELPAGGVEQVRLILGPNNYIRVDGEMLDLKVPSGMQSGLKFAGAWTVSPGFRTEIILDFDPEKSIVYAPGNGYLLKPVVRVDTATVPIDSVSSIIDAETGGTLRLGDQFVLHVPPGALSNDTVLWAQETKTAGLTSHFELGPDGTQFAIPATSTLQYRPQAIPAGVLAQNLVVLQDDVPIPTSVDTTHNLLFADVSHFTGLRGGTVDGDSGTTVSSPDPPSAIVLEESDAAVECSGPAAYWHAASIGSGGEMQWTYNNDFSHGAQNHCIYHFTGLTPGSWEVQAFIPKDKANTRHACYEVSVNKPVGVEVDQSTVFDDWVSLGAFQSLGSLDVALSDLTGEAWTNYWVGFDAIRVIPAPVGPTTPGKVCTPRVLAASGAPEPLVELREDVKGIDFVWTWPQSGSNESSSPADVVVFRGETADKLRSLAKNDTTAMKGVLLLLLAMQFDGIISSAMASDGDMNAFVDKLVQDQAFEIALGEAFPALSDINDLVSLLVQYWIADRVVDVVAATSGDIYIVLTEYPKFQLPIPHYYTSGRLFAANDLQSATLAKLNPFVDVLYFQTLDEVERNPDDMTLGKANHESTGFLQWTDVPKPNNYQWSFWDGRWEAP